jgi:site-specific recombinase XerD
MRRASERNVSVPERSPFTATLVFRVGRAPPWFFLPDRAEPCESARRQARPPHVLRHTFASVLTERGASPFAVQRVMGHSRLETTGIYVHLSGETLRDEIESHLG